MIKGTLVKRYKRFLADCILENGEEITAHCPNSGRMTGCVAEGAPVILSKSDNPKRKYAHTLELVKMPSSWVCANTNQANRVGFEAIRDGLISELAGYENIKAEVTYPQSKSRVDIELTDEKLGRCFVEIKSCTLVEDGVAMFPDAPTVRGQKHLDELVEIKQLGIRPVVLFLIMRNDAQSFTPAKEIDPKFAEKLSSAVAKGVEVLAYHVDVQLGTFSLKEKIPVTFS